MAHVDSVRPHLMEKQLMQHAKTSKYISAALVAIMVMVMVPNVRANDLSELPCTAGDVEIVGSGIVVNEPCVCPPGGTFTASVRFVVRNNTSTGRYCIALHLVPDGALLTQPLDLVLRDANGSSTALGKTGSQSYRETVMFASIPNFPCNARVICFGSSGVTRGKCTPGGCTTVSWNTSNGAGNCTTADQAPPGGQCRHQQVCVIGFGATLACTANCGTSCEGSATLRACVTGPTSRGPYTVQLQGNDGSSQSQSTLGDASGQVCLNFTVSPGLAPTTDYTLTVTDKDGCTRTATTSLNVRKKPTAAAGDDQAKCSSGATTSFTLAGVATNGTGVWSVVSGPVTVADSTNLSTGATFTGTGTATLRLTVTNAPCQPKTDDVILTVNANPTANAGTNQNKCSAGNTTSFTMAGSATGGTATWSIVSGPVSIADIHNLNTGVTFTGGGTAKLRLTVVSDSKPACPDAVSEVDLAVTVTSVSITPAPNPACSGVQSFTAAVAGSSGCSFEWTVDGVALASFLAASNGDDARVARVSGSGNNTLELRALDNACHVIGVTASCSGAAGTCSGTATTTAKQCVGSAQSCSPSISQLR